jgi:tetratricopeptide (TPR) repeat protein
MPVHQPQYKLYYLQVPAELAREVGSFQLDPSIPLPVEGRWSAGRADEVPNLEDLSWEQIVAAMLKIMAWERNHSDFAYYRDFILAVRPEVWQELSATAIVKAQAKEFRMAEEIFLALEGLDPTHPRTLLNLALLYDEEAEALSQHGQSAEADELLVHAQKKFSQALVTTPPLPDAYFYAGFFHLKQKNLDRAKGLFEAFFELAKEDTKKIEAARKALAEAERQSRLDNLFKEAYDFILLGKEEEGIKRLDGFLKEHPQIWNAWFLLGWARRRLSQWKPALEAFQTALDKGGDQVDTYNEMAICAMELGDLTQARRLLEKALRKDGENTKIISNLGVLALKAGKDDEAISFFETVLEYDPDDPVAPKMIEQIKASSEAKKDT